MESKILPRWGKLEIGLVSLKLIGLGTLSKGITSMCVYEDVKVSGEYVMFEKRAVCCDWLRESWEE